MLSLHSLCWGASAVSMDQTLQKVLDAWRIQNAIPGATLLVQTPKETVSLVSGTKTMQGRQAITLNTLFGVGSITKTFVSTMILRLEAEGKLSINDPIKKYLPEYPRWKNITIKDLLNMTSGIPNFITATDPSKIEGGLFNTVSTDQWIEKSYQLPDVFPPGTQWQYNNINYFLLGKIITAITHQSLEKVLQENFFSPLHLQYTFYSQTSYSKEIIAQMAHGYYNDIDTTLVKPSNYSAGGAMLMNAQDIKTWVDHLYVQQDVLPEVQLNEMLTGTPLSVNVTRKFYPPESTYALGVIVTHDKAFGKMIWYVGVIYGYSSVFIYIPDKKIIIAAQMNRWTGGEYNLLFPNQKLIQTVLDIIEKNNSAQFQKKFAELESSAQGQLGISAINTANNEVLQYRANERFPFCSTGKVMIAAAILAKSEKNPTLLQKVIYYTQKDIEQSGYAPITQKQLSTGITIAQLCEAMMDYSDNAAANLLIKQLGGVKGVNAYARSIGDKTFRLDRLEPDLNSAIPGDKRDTTTPSAMVKSLRALLFGDSLAESQRMLLETWLKNNTTGNDRIRAGVPKGWSVGDKTGTGEYGTTHDIGIIWPPHCAPIIVAIYFRQHTQNAPARVEVIAKATRLLMAEFAQTDTCLQQ